MKYDDLIIGPHNPILVTGATGFIGLKLVQTLLNSGFRNLICFTRSPGKVASLNGLASGLGQQANVRIVEGNLLSREDCAIATRDAEVIFHLAAGGSDKSYPDAVMNSVVTTRNLLEQSRPHNRLRRFVNISSLAVYTNTNKHRRNLLDESCPVETRPELRGDAYCFAKLKQDEIVTDYGKRFGISYVIIRPGYVYGPGKDSIPSRVGIGTFGLFLHLGGSNAIPFTYVDNCANAIVMAGLNKRTDRQVFNVVDDDLPSSRQFLRLYKRNVRRFKSLYVPHVVSHALCCMWERYSEWSEGQLPPLFNDRRWHAYWKNTSYSNEKLKTEVGWTPPVSTAEGLRRFVESCRDAS
jgi:nucleoside-diphosphate-sugar epimerase